MYVVKLDDISIQKHLGHWLSKIYAFMEKDGKR